MAGKGSKKIPAQVPPAVEDRNWKRIKGFPERGILAERKRKQKLKKSKAAVN